MWGHRAVNALMNQAGKSLEGKVPEGHVVTIRFTGFVGAGESYPPVIVNDQTSPTTSE